MVACLGTDQHPFPRLVRWLDDLAASHPEYEVVVQHGFSEAPRVSTGHAFMSYDSLFDLIVSADLTVCHGGPGTLMDAHRAGHVPVVVPRDPQFGEHVDGHQLRFANAIERRGRVDVARDQQTFDNLVDQRLRTVLRTPASVPALTDEPSGLKMLAAHLERMPRHPPRRAPLIRSALRAVHR